MPIIIPSSHSSRIINDKITKNKISGVAFSEMRFSYITEVSANLATISSSTSATNKTIYGNWLYIDNQTRERLKIYVETTSIAPTDANAPTKLDEYDITETNITGYIKSSNYGNITFNIAAIKSSNYEIKIPFPNLEIEALNLYAKFFLRNNISTNIAYNFSGSKDLIYIHIPTSLSIYTETETLIGDKWELYKTTTKLNDTINEAVYNVYVGKITKRQKSTSYVLGENADYSLSSTTFFKQNIKINEKTLGNFISEKIIESYKNGKETATITCIIGDYFDENGNKVISIDDGRMTFDLYDEVVPMIYTNLGDRPMSLTENGKAKIFVVLGTNVFYDGAVWQELTLQETSKGIDISKTTYTTIANKAGGLTYKITSNEIVTKENSAGGITYIIGE